jgi:hypothetical protein
MEQCVDYQRPAQRLHVAMMEAKGEVAAVSKHKTRASGLEGEMMKCPLSFSL